jgi:hypothetical protein
MKYSVEYKNGEPTVVKFEYNIKVFIEEGTAAVYKNDNLYPALSDEAQSQLFDALWEFDFVEEVEVKDESREENE